jgi:solute carrier family 25 carnitine/acylcarnitine transporter 20/29
MYHVGASIVARHGWRRLFRGLGITLVRAFPVNGTIFPVYEFTLMQINRFAASES